MPACLLGYFLLASLLEYNLWLGGTARLGIFILFFALVAVCCYYFLRKPVQWWLYGRGLNEEESARLIGNFFPAVSDRLLNIIQLAAAPKKSALLDASIAQKAQALQPISFEKAVDLSANKKYLRYLLVPLAVAVVLTFVDSGIFTKSATRIIRFNQEFSPEAPFQFNILNKELFSFFNEDFTLHISLDGNAIPDAAYLVAGSQRWKMENLGKGDFQYTFEKLQNAVTFQIEASGFFSPLHKINLINRPEVLQIKTRITYPSYIGRSAETITNVGNLDVPEGAQVRWEVTVAHANKAEISFASPPKTELMQSSDNQLFTFQRAFRNPDEYTIVLANESSRNKDKISYRVTVTKDQFPQIMVENLRDSVLFQSVLLGGQLKDDYGVTKLLLHYQRENSDAKSRTIDIPVLAAKPQQNFFFNWRTDSLHLAPGDKLNYFLEVWDNDGVNGHKATRSATYTFALPTKDELKTDIASQQQATEQVIDKSVQKAKDLKQAIDEAQEKLRGKQSLDWQDKKMLEDLMKQRQKLDQAIEELQKENKLLEQKKDAFTSENPKIKEKAEQIQKLMNELLDDETKKLFKELEKLLNQNADLQQIQKALDKMDRKEMNLEKELERTLSLFKQLQYDYKLDQAVNDLKSQLEKQENLLKKTEESATKSDDKAKSDDKSKPDDKKDGAGESQKTNEELAKEQEKVREETEKFDQSLDNLKKLGEEINRDEELPGKEDVQQLKQSEEESQKSLEQGNRKKSAAEQKKSRDQMKKMEQQMQGMQNSMEMEIDTQNLESLRQIVHGLIKLSFDQESLMKEFSSVQQADPKIVGISQRQLKLQDDAKVLEDSLLALSKKDPFMGSVVTREVGELNDHIGKAVSGLKDRHKNVASSEMQFSMTNINNLALMLNDHFDMMMKMMANAMPSKGKGKKGKSGQSLGKMQQQINDKIEQLKNGQKTGRQYSEELARMAAEQERIRKALQEMQDRLKKEGGKLPGNDLPGKMEQTEFDLVNKQITEETIRRQKEILTRLLETEKSMREQNQDEERKGETAKDYDKEIPRAFEEYIRLKEKEVELLKTMPPKLFPYYKKEVTEYFKRIN